ncbi:molybdopterin cofactor-binding domain-containing protein [uncultured Cohaesibacter sp.]|uniref:xanthine dehydrogenase family protein molybdopterin-binding subunit n=1 Tax=uncultured Cohaesibacter sp. TaxID=1002546 RepID=UPI00292D0386|nr:molybdopterin cofactor-binding domain-containing protein [uncultured Cohaesibacter sp.]
MKSGSIKPSRRTFLIGTGLTAVGLSVGFYLGVNNFPILPSSTSPDPDDGRFWLHMTKEGEVVLFSPVHDLGQGTPSSLTQIIAEELNLDPLTVRLVLPDSAQIPYMRFTIGSHGMSDHALPTARAAAFLRETLHQKAAEKFAVAPDLISDRRGGGRVGERTVAYAQLIASNENLILPDAIENVPLYTFDAGREKRSVGQMAPDRQARAIVRGEPLYVDDIRLPDMLHGRVVQAPCPDARIKSANTRDVARMHGVVKVVFDPSHAFLGVIATTPSALNLAMGALEVIWEGAEPLDNDGLARLVDVDAFLAKGRLEHQMEKADISSDLEWTIDHRLDLPPLHHAQQELRTAVAQFTSEDGLNTLHLWVGTQDAFVHRRKAARDLGWPEERIIVHPLRTGGAFGGRALYDVGREALLLARHAEVPVKVQWTRPDEFLADRARPPSSHRLRIRANRDGHITDWWQATVSGHFLLTEIMGPEWALDIARLAIADFGATRSIHPPYGAVNRRVEFQDVELPVHVGQMRALGATPNTTIIEIGMDRLARRLDMDPIELRLLNLGPEHPRLKACLERLRAMIETNPLETGEARGIACGIYHDKSFVACAFDVASRNDGPIEAKRAFCAMDVGLVINPDRVKAQVEGCLMMAIGQVLFEKAIVTNGTFTSKSFKDYPAPTFRHVPDMHIELLDARSTAPAGAGEAPLIAAVPALTNAVSRIQKMKITRLPIEVSQRPHRTETIW